MLEINREKREKKKGGGGGGGKEEEKNKREAERDIYCYFEHQSSGAV